MGSSSPNGDENKKCLKTPPRKGFFWIWCCLVLGLVCCQSWQFVRHSKFMFCSLSPSQALRFDLPEKWQFFFCLANIWHFKWTIHRSCSWTYPAAVHSKLKNPTVAFGSRWFGALESGYPRSNNPFHFRGSQESKPPIKRGGHIFKKKHAFSPGSIVPFLPFSSSGDLSRVFGE